MLCTSGPQTSVPNYTAFPGCPHTQAAVHKPLTHEPPLPTQRLRTNSRFPLQTPLFQNPLLRSPGWLSKVWVTPSKNFPVNAKLVPTHVRQGETKKRGHLRTEGGSFNKQRTYVPDSPRTLQEEQTNPPTSVLRSLYSCLNWICSHILCRWSQKHVTPMATCLKLAPAVLIVGITDISRMRGERPPGSRSQVNQWLRSLDDLLQHHSTIIKMMTKIKWLNYLKIMESQHWCKRNRKFN